jgi:hypothetical protein
MVFENRVLRGILGPKRNIVRWGGGVGENCVMRSFIT